MCNEKCESIEQQVKTFVYTEEMQRMHGEKMAKAKADAFYNDIGDVHWEDLEFYTNKARNDKDRESFDIALRILTALRMQVLNNSRKN